MARFVGRLHRDQQGTMSILSVFTVMFLTMLLGVVMNAGRQVDGKIRMQNAADAVSYSGAATMARGMNLLAFTNHMLCEVFAMTAWLEEARDQNAKSYVPRILAAWRNAGEVLSASSNLRLQRLGRAIIEKVPLEQAVVDTFSAWAEAVSGLMLPVMRGVLDQELIPAYQRIVVQYWPDVAQATAREVALRHSEPAHGRGAMTGTLYWADMTRVSSSQYSNHTLPALDPTIGDALVIDRRVDEARKQRAIFAHWYLGLWNDDTLRFFRSGASREYGGSARLSMFYPLWCTFTCGRLDDALSRYLDSNLPHVIAEDLTPPVRQSGANTMPEADEAAEVDTTGRVNRVLEDNYIVVGAVRWSSLPLLLPRMITNPVRAAPLTFAEAQYFVPQRRRYWRRVDVDAGSTVSSGMPGFGGVPGELLDPPEQDSPDPGPGGTAPESSPSTESQWVIAQERTDGLPATARDWLPYFDEWGHVANRDRWTLFNQNWTARLTPAWQDGISGLTTGNSLNRRQLHRLSPH
jgi:hypothetical protein